MKILALLLCFLQLNIFSFTTKTPQGVVSLKNETEIVNSLAEEVGTGLDIEYPRMYEYNINDYDIWRVSYSKSLTNITSFDIDNNENVLIMGNRYYTGYKLSVYNKNNEFSYGFKLIEPQRGSYWAEWGNSGILIFYGEVMVEYDYNAKPLRLFKVKNANNILDISRYFLKNKTTSTGEVYIATTNGNTFTDEVTIIKKIKNDTETIVYNSSDAMFLESLIYYSSLVVFFVIVSICITIYVIKARKKYKEKNQNNAKE